MSDFDNPHIEATHDQGEREGEAWARSAKPEELERMVAQIDESMRLHNGVAFGEIADIITAQHPGDPGARFSAPLNAGFMQGILKAHRQIIGEKN